MQQTLRKLLLKVLGYIELLFALVLLAAILLSAVGLIAQSGVFHGKLFDFDGFTEFLTGVFTLVIGIEFVRMLVRHTPDAVIEVLLFAIARQLVIEHNDHWKMLIGIVCIAGVFAIRKYLFTRSFSGAGLHVFNAKKTVRDANKIADTHLPDLNGITIGTLMLQKMKDEENTVEEGATAHFGDVTLRIATMRDGNIETIDMYNAGE